MVAPGASLGTVDERISSPGRGERTTWRAGSSFQQVLSPLRGFGHVVSTTPGLRLGYHLPPLRGYFPNSGLACEARTAPLFGTIPAVNAPQAGPLVRLQVYVIREVKVLFGHSFSGP